jgi:hypothetical protein
LSLATFGLFMQIAFVYWFTAVLKSGPEWRSDYTALYYALSLDQLATPIGHFLLDFPGLLQVLTFGTFTLEALGLFLLFCPFFTGPVRTGAALAVMSLHFGIWLTMDIGIFPWISAFCMVCFFPTWFWEKAAMLHSVLLGRFEPARRLQLAAARAGRAIVAFSLTILAFLADARQLLFGFPAPHGDSVAAQTAAAVPPLAVGTTGQGETVAEMGARHDTLVEEPADLLAFFCVFYILCWNLTTVTSFTLPERTVPLGPFLGLEQYWGMFAPSPTKEDGWYVIPGELRDGQKVDLMPITRDDYGVHPVSYEKPQDVPATYKNEHWRKYLENIYNQDFADERLYFGQYICRQWNAHHVGADSLETFRIIYMREMTLPNYQQSKPEKIDLWNHTC